MKVIFKKNQRKRVIYQKKTNKFSSNKVNLSLVLFFFRFLLIIFIPLTLLLLPQFFIRINEISCNNQYGPCSKYVEDKLHNLKGKNMWIFRKEISESFSGDVIVEKYSFLFKFPDIEEVSVVERVAKFAIKRYDSQTYGLVDKDGKVLAYVTSTNLPCVNEDTVLPNKGSSVDSETFFAAKILNDLASYYNIQSGDKSGSDLTLSIDGKKIIFPLQGDEKALVGGFNLIYSKLKSDSADTGLVNSDLVKTIDMRFKNPVLSF